MSQSWLGAVGWPALAPVNINARSRSSKSGNRSIICLCAAEQALSGVRTVLVGQGTSADIDFVVIREKTVKGKYVITRRLKRGTADEVAMSDGAAHSLKGVERFCATA